MSRYFPKIMLLESNGKATITINCFLLYIHRNTLVYRLDKLQKSTGLDLRVFEDAITFKIALMVVKYMKYMEFFEY